MSFAAPVFLWYFLPAVLLVSWVLPHGARNGVLAASSLVFYAFGGKQFVLLLVAVMAANFAAGLAIGTLGRRPSDAATRGRRGVTAKGLLVVTVVADLLVIGFWKYLGFTSGIVHSLGRALGFGDTRVLNLALPIGISFFTFHHLSYVIDVYRGVRPPLGLPRFVCKRH